MAALGCVSQLVLNLQFVLLQSPPPAFPTQTGRLRPLVAHLQSPETEIYATQQAKLGAAHKASTFSL